MPNPSLYEYDNVPPFAERFTMPSFNELHVIIFFEKTVKTNLLGSEIVICTVSVNPAVSVTVTT